jgi:hypothetical protein
LAYLAWQLGSLDFEHLALKAIFLTTLSMQHQQLIIYWQQLSLAAFSLFFVVSSNFNEHEGSTPLDWFNKPFASLQSNLFKAISLNAR